MHLLCNILVHPPSLDAGAPKRGSAFTCTCRAMIPNPGFAEILPETRRLDRTRAECWRHLTWGFIGTASNKIQTKFKPYDTSHGISVSLLHVLPSSPGVPSKETVPPLDPSLLSHRAPTLSSNPLLVAQKNESRLCPVPLVGTLGLSHACAKRLQSVTPPGQCITTSLSDCPPRAIPAPRDALRTEFCPGVSCLCLICCFRRQLSRRELCRYRLGLAPTEL